MFVEFTYNAALLITLSVLYGLLTRLRRGSNIQYKLFAGLLFGLIAIAGMYMPVQYKPGVFYDGRSVIMVLAGLFGGGIVSGISILLAGAYRIYLGGEGTVAGIMTIVSCVAVGLIFRRIYKKPEDIRLIMLWVIGIIAHVLMLLSLLLLPWPLGLEVIQKIWGPVLLFFPVATFLIGILLITEEKRFSALIKIEKGERLFQTLSENSPVGIFRTRPDGCTTYVNPRWSRITGISYKNAMGKGWLDAVHPEDRNNVINKWRKAVDNQVDSVEEYRFIGEDGRVIWVYGEAVPEYSGDGEIIGYIGTIIDITQRKKFEKALVQSEENFRRSLDESPLGVRIINMQGENIYANQSLLDICGGGTLDEFLNMRFSNLYTEESSRLHAVRKEKRLNGEYVSSEYETAIINWKKEIRYLQVFRKEIIWNGIPHFQALYSDITERKIAEQALFENEEALKEAEQIAQMGSWTFYIDENISKWSENHYRILGFQPYEVEPSYESFKSRIHPEDLHLIYESQEKIDIYKKPVEIQLRITFPEKACRWILIKMIPHFDDERLVTVKGIIMDINDIKQAVLALQESERNYRNLFENHSAIKLMINPLDGGIINANHAAAKFYGWTIEELKGMNIRQITVMEEKKIEKELKKAVNGKNVHFEFKHRLADNAVRNMEVFTSKIKFQGKDCLHFIIHNVTQKKEAEEKLKLLSKSIEQSPVSILITDPSGKIEYVNPKFSETTGYLPDEILGKNPNISKSGYHSREFYEDLWKTIFSGENWTGEVQNKRKNGELYWESVIISPMLGSDGRITNFICVKEDITERKKMIREVIEAKEKAEESERLKSAFLANMSHEIRTPLNAILGFTQMLSFEPDLSPEEKEEYSSIINKSAESLLQIISDILDISQLETRQLKIFKKQFTIQEMFSDIFSQCKKKMTDEQKEKIDLKMEMPDEKIVIYTDYIRLTQILMNLLTNAIKFTEKGYINFGIFYHDQNQIGFFVSDTGIGIAKSIQRSIFERFRQADNSTTRIYGGTGLGLSIVKSLTELLGGEIHLESEEGEGTTFRFYLPVR